MLSTLSRNPIFSISFPNNIFCYPSDCLKMVHSFLTVSKPVFNNSRDSHLAFKYRIIKAVNVHLGRHNNLKILCWRIKTIALYTALLQLVIQGTHFHAKFYPTFPKPISQFIKTCLNSASVSCVHAIPPSLVSPANLMGSLSISLSRSVMEPLNTSGLRRDT